MTSHDPQDDIKKEEIKPSDDIKKTEEEKTTSFSASNKKEEKTEVNPHAATDEKEIKIEELKNALARAMADLQNYKRRSEEEKMSFVRFANVELLKALLPFVDNLERSVAHLPENMKTDNWAQGIVHIQKDLLKTLDQLGIKKIKTVGEKLDPIKHEGLMSGPGEKDKIVEEFEPGYMMGEVVIKVARVKVGDGS